MFWAVSKARRAEFCDALQNRQEPHFIYQSDNRNQIYHIAPKRVKYYTLKHLTIDKWSDSLVVIKLSLHDLVWYANFQKGNIT